MAKAKDIKLIRGALSYFSSERTQFKPYGYSLNFTKEGGAQKTILVELEIPAEHILEEDADTITISFDGLTVMLEKAADAIDVISENYINRFIPK